MSNDVITASGKSMSMAPQNLEQAMVFAEHLSRSDIVPKDYQGKPGNVLVAIQWGMELGLQPMQAMQNIAVINGRPSLWGDAVIGLVKASPLCEYVVEDVSESGATCRVKRVNEPEQSRIFTLEDAKKAGLLGKAGPWAQYTKRMLQMRARSWALRDVFPDVLRGIPVAEEVMDIPPERDITPKTAAGAGEAARIAGNADDPERPGLIAKLENIARTGTADDLAYEWQQVLTKEQRKSIGGAEWERIKGLLQPVTGNTEEREPGSDDD